MLKLIPKPIFVLIAPPTYSALIIERKIVGAVISVNFYYRLIGEKKERGESAVIPGVPLPGIALAIIYGLDCNLK